MGKELLPNHVRSRPDRWSGLQRPPRKLPLAGGERPDDGQLDRFGRASKQRSRRMGQSAKLLPGVAILRADDVGLLL